MHCLDRLYIQIDDKNLEFKRLSIRTVWTCSELRYWHPCAGVTDQELNSQYVYSTARSSLLFHFRRLTVWPSHLSLHCLYVLYNCYSDQLWREIDQPLTTTGTTGWTMEDSGFGSRQEEEGFFPYKMTKWPKSLWIPPSFLLSVYRRTLHGGGGGGQGGWFMKLTT